VDAIRRGWTKKSARSQMYMNVHNGSLFSYKEVSGRSLPPSSPDYTSEYNRPTCRAVASQKIKVLRKYRRKFWYDFIKDTSLPNIVILFLHVLKGIRVLVKQPGRHDHRRRPGAEFGGRKRIGQTKISQ